MGRQFYTLSCFALQVSQEIHLSYSLMSIWNTILILGTQYLPSLFHPSNDNQNLFIEADICINFDIIYFERFPSLIWKILKIFLQII